MNIDIDIDSKNDISFRDSASGKAQNGTEWHSMENITRNERIP